MSSLDMNRMSRRRFLKLVSSGVAAGAVAQLVGCRTPERAVTEETPSLTATPSQVLKTLRIVAGESDGPTATMDPALGVDGPDAMRCNLAYDQLVWQDSNFAPQPMLAESWEVNDRGDQWTFYLRQDVKFHDGSRFTANDVLYTFRRVLDPETGSAGAALLSGVDPDGIEALDDYTVRFNLPDPIVAFPLSISSRFTWIVKEGMTSEELRANGIGTGPFRVEEFVPGEERSLWTKHEDYWMSGLPMVDAVEMRSIDEPAARIAALERGLVDIIEDVSMTRVEDLEANPDINVVSVRTPYYFHMAMQCDTPPFDDNRVRLALKYCQDREQFLDVMLGGYGSVANDCPVAPWVEYGIDEPPREQDIPKARQLLEDAGYGDGLDLELHTSTTMDEYPVMAALFKEMAAEAGVNITIKSRPAEGYWSEVWMQEPFVCSSWAGRNADEALTVKYLSTAEWNDTSYRNEDFDQLIRRARETVDYEERKALYRQAQKIIIDDGGDLIPVFRDALTATGPNVEGWAPHAQGNLKDYRRVRMT